MDELDARLRAMAKREVWALPAAYESAMDGLEEQIRQSTLDRPGKRRLGKAGAVAGGGAGSTGLWFCRGGGAHGLAEPSGG